MDNLTKLRYWTFKILPLVYDDSLSYYEVLAKVTNKVNELVDSNNTMPQAITDEITKQLDESYAANINNKINSAVNTVTENANNQIDKLANEVTDLNNKFNSAVNTVTENANNQIDKLANEVYAKLITAIATDEGTNTFTKDAKSGGELIFLNGTLYKVTAIMQAGTNYIIGTNVIPVDISEELKTIKETYISSNNEHWNERSTKDYIPDEYLFWKDDLYITTKYIKVNDLLYNSGDNQNIKQITLTSKITELTEKANNIQNSLVEMVNNVSSPIFVDSVDNMTDNTKVYVLSSNGHVYFYNNGFKDTGLIYGVNNLFFTGGSTNIAASTQLADLNDTLPNRVYVFDKASTANLPVSNFRGVVITFDNNENKAYQYQVAISLNNDRYERINTGDGNWSDWKTTYNQMYFTGGTTSVGSSVQLADLNDALPNRVYVFDHTSTTNLPVSWFRGIVLTFDNNEDKAYQYQVAYDFNNGRYERINIGAGNWSAWKKIKYEKEVVNLSTASEIYNAFKSGNKNVTYNIEPGTYDLYTGLIENDILNNSGYQVFFGDNVTINGCNAELTCYVPSSVYAEHTNACLDTSVINTRYNCEVNDLTIRVKNIRYCIHDEAETNTDAYNTKHTFNNLNLYTSTDSAAYTRPIGIGGSKGQRYIFNNCHFDYNNAFYIHGRGYNIGEITFNYCTVGDGQYINLSQYTSNNRVTSVNINNCKIKLVRVTVQSGGSTTLQYAIKATNCGALSIVKDDETTFIKEPIIINTWQ